MAMLRPYKKDEWLRDSCKSEGSNEGSWDSTWEPEVIEIDWLDIEARLDDVVGSLDIEGLLDFRVWSYEEVEDDEERG